MKSALFLYPRQALYDRVLPKSKIYEYAEPTSGVRELFVGQVDKIVWQYKLAPKTLNLPAKSGVTEIQIFSVTLKSQKLNEEVLRCIDKAIPFPIFYEIIFQDKVRMATTYKRPSEADVEKWVVSEHYFETLWQPQDDARISLPIVLDMASLYEQMLRCYLPLPQRLGESLEAQLGRLENIRMKQGETQRLEARLKKEKQFNRRIEINTQLRQLETELDYLSR